MSTFGARPLKDFLAEISHRGSTRRSERFAKELVEDRLALYYEEYDITT